MILDEILRNKREEVAARKRARPFASIRREAEGRPDLRPFRKSLRHEQIALIAEIKRASPSAGLIRGEVDAAAIAAAYEEGGASALSVVTDERYFRGSLALLREARAAVSLPVLAKDFHLEPYPIAEAAAAGADAFLLIAGALGRSELADLAAFGRELGLDPLVEVHTEGDLEEALAAGAETIGVNNRDLATFRVDIGTALALARLIPNETVRVGESGIREAADVRLLRDHGYDAVLVGEALMRADSPREAVRSLLGGAS
jgi:indole-3-glycerol phosphate synthase